MADYHAVLKRAIDALPENSGAARRAVYQKARAAIVNQLKSYDPPLSPSEITTEQLRLEEAIRKVEADAARLTLGLGPQSSAPAPSKSVAPEVSVKSENDGASASTTEPSSDETLKAQAPAVSSPVASEPQASDTPNADNEVKADTKPQLDAKPPADEKSEAKPVSDSSQSPETKSPETKLPETKSSEPKSGGGFFSGLVGKSGAKSVDKAELKGSDAKADDKTDQKSGAATGPAMGKAASADTPKTSVEPKSSVEASTGDVNKPARDFGKSRDDVSGSPLLGSIAAQIGRGGKVAPSKLPTIAAGLAALIIFGGLIVGVYSQREAILAMISPAESDAPSEQVSESPTPPAAEAERAAKGAERLLNDDGSPAAPDALAVTTTRIVPPAGENGEPATDAAPDEAPATVRTITPETSAEVTTPEAPETPQASDAPGTSGDNVTETPLAALPAIQSQQPSQGQAGLLVAQRSILYEEGEGADSTGSAAQGQVSWTTARESAAGSEEIDTVLKAKVVIPDRNVTVNVTIRPNRDTSLPASHLIEIMFTLPPEFSGKGVSNVPGLIMKTTEEARGDALIGASVRVDSGFFWVALSALEQEKQRNETLLRDRGWIDIPILYDNGKRAILTLEKGTPGEKAVQLALDAWSNS